MCSSGVRFNTRMSFYQYRKPHYKVKTVLPPTYLYNGNSRTYKEHIYIETGLLVFRVHIGLGLQGLYSATSCADNILGRFKIILQNQIARVDSFKHLTKRWVLRFRVNASISSHNLISFDKQFDAEGPYTANARLPKVSCLNFGTFRTRSSLDLMEYILLFDGWSFLGSR